VQAEAARRAGELFPNLSDGDFLPADFKEDEEAGFVGLPFIQLRGSREGWANGFHAVRERNPRSSVRHAPRNYLWPNYYSRVNSLISFTYTST
jgi:hypothetical protein